jgi:8-amino-7-oxononanoate synthase
MMGVINASALERRIRDRLLTLESQGLTRILRPPSGVDLSSNDYLGLASHPLLKQRMTQAVLEEGCGSTGSRLLRGERSGFARVESAFARFKDTQRSLYFSSGYLANLAVLSTFPGPEDVIFSDERNHASIIDGCRLSRARRVIFPHNDATALSAVLESTECAGQRFVVVESLFSMDGDFAPLGQYADICRTAGASLIVDEAHAVGIYGRNGSGRIEAEGAADSVFLSINTAGKALGVAGAFVAGTALACEYLVQTARPFIFSTAPPPSTAAALETSLELIAAEPGRRERLLRLCRLLRASLAEAGIAVPAGESQIIPIHIGDNSAAVAVAASLQSVGFDVRAIRPPSVPDGTARLRVSLNVNLDEATLSRFVAALAGALQESIACAASS